MTTSTAPMDDATDAPDGRRRLIAALLLLAGIALAWQGGWMSAFGVAAAVLGALGWKAGQPVFGPARDSDAPSAGSTPSAPTPSASAASTVGGRHGAEVMVSQVVPVWSRQMELTRDVSSEGLAGILNAFSEISGALSTLTDLLGAQSVTAEPGAVDAAVRHESVALDVLKASSARAFAERDTAVAELVRCTDGMLQLKQQAKLARELARHTRLVAFNASIEAQRVGAGSAPAGASSGSAGAKAGGGQQAVAGEVRMLAARMAETAERIERLIAEMEGPLVKARRIAEIGDSTDEELRMEIDLSARAALQALLASLGTALQSSEAVQQATDTLRSQLEESFVHFQFGDRVSQMLSIVGNDMTNFVQWVAQHPRATQSDAAAWLQALEQSYTMEEQRSGHHGNVHVEQTAGVEFF